MSLFFALSSLDSQSDGGKGVLFTQKLTNDSHVQGPSHCAFAKLDPIVFLRSGVSFIVCPAEECFSQKVVDCGHVMIVMDSRKFIPISLECHRASLER